MIVKEGGLCAKNEDPKVEAIPLFNYQNGTTIYDTLHSKADRVNITSKYNSVSQGFRLLESLQHNKIDLDLIFSDEVF